MKRNVLVGMLFIASFMVVIYKLYDPPSPVNHLSGKEILEKLHHSNEKVVMIAKEDKTIWYITRNHNNGMKEVDEKVKEMLKQKGWSYKDKEGSGLFFEKNSERIIVTTEMWMRKYVLIKVPENV